MLSALSDIRAAEGNAGASQFSLGTSLRAPAVAQVNGKISYAGGDMDSAEGHNFDGSITIPVSRQFGFQADALYSRIDEQDFFGGAGHFFWRKPELGLIGVSGGYLAHEDVDTFQVGAEGEYYLDRFTFGLFAGVGSIHFENAVPFIDTEPTRFIGRVSADWYALDDLRVGASYTTAFDNNLVKGEAEYQTPLPGLAITAEIARGDHGYDHWLLGVRYYFGGKKSLRDRHRQDDPRSLMPQILHGLGSYGAELNRNAKSYFASHPDSGNWSTSGASFSIISIHDIWIPVGAPFPPLPAGPPGNPGPHP
jgi:hypothetical protein